MNPIELQQTIQKAVDAKMSGQDRLAKLLAHRLIVYLTVVIHFQCNNYCTS